MPQDRRSQEPRSRHSGEHSTRSSERPRKSQKKKRKAGSALSFTALYVLFVIGTSVLLACLGWIAANDMLALNKEAHSVTVSINADDSFSDVVNMLKENGLIEHKALFKLFTLVSHSKDKIASSGTFTLNTDMDYHALISGISANSATRAEVQVTIPEGFTVDQIFRLLEEKGVATVEDLQREAAEHDYQFSFLKDIPLGNYKRLEGYLHPDTYTFYTPHDPVYVLNKMLVNFDNRVDDNMRTKIENSGHTLREILTIASMIEKETDGTDRARIASVIYNRLKNPGYETNGRLEIDATIYYITGQPVTQNDRATLDSPYNTSMYKGLPPGPIANPGMESILAAMNPANESYYYYALGDDGKHHYYKSYSGLQQFINSQELYKKP